PSLQTYIARPRPVKGLPPFANCSGYAEDVNNDLSLTYVAELERQVAERLGEKYLLWVGRLFRNLRRRRRSAEVGGGKSFGFGMRGMCRGYMCWNVGNRDGFALLGRLSAEQTDGTWELAEDSKIADEVGVGIVATHFGLTVNRDRLSSVTGQVKPGQAVLTGYDCNRAKTGHDRLQIDAPILLHHKATAYSTPEAGCQYPDLKVDSKLVNSPCKGTQFDGLCYIPHWLCGNSSYVHQFTINFNAHLVVTRM
ncbi:hypothetical protein BDZ89DRAFT_1051593, partial [Hymenopellis radicata]